MSQIWKEKTQRALQILSNLNDLSYYNKVMASIKNAKPVGDKQRKRTSTQDFENAHIFKITEVDRVNKPTGETKEV